jgi:hypothetical protein
MLSVLVVPVGVITGGVRSDVQVTVLDAVLELPQVSIAVNVLICVTIQPAVVASASEKVRLVTVPQPSVAVAVPNAALISAAVGLHAKCIGSTSWRDHWWSKIRSPGHCS